jgi:hypothetical protein
MKDENPFRAWLASESYRGQWVPVARLGGWTEPASCPALVPPAAEQEVLKRPDWPLHVGRLGRVCGSAIPTKDQYTDQPCTASRSATA